jgi:hypothetical protein
MTFSPGWYEKSKCRRSGERRGNAIGAATFLLMGLLLLSGCQSVHRAASERFSLARQDSLVREIDRASRLHQATADQLGVALETYQYVLDPEEFSLRERYELLSREYVRAERLAADTRERIEDMEHAARAHFVDWENRLYEYTDPVIRNASRQQLDASRQEYERVVTHVRRTETRTNRVIQAFGDQVRFLRHNLNQQAIGALRNPATELQLEVTDLMEEMQKAGEALQILAASLRIE